MKTMIPPQVGMRLRTLQKEKKRKKEKKAKEKKEKKEERPKEKKKKEIKRGQCYYLFFHTCASKQHHVLHIVSLICCHFHILVRIFHYKTWLVYTYDGLPQMPQVFVSKQVGCTPTSFPLLSFHSFIALSASVAWQSQLLMLTSIDGHLHSPLIILVNVRLSPFFFSAQSPSSYSIPPIVLYPWLMLMYCVKVEKV